LVLVLSPIELVGKDFADLLICPGMVLWDKVFYEVAKEYEGVVEHDKMLVDAMTVRMVNNPESLDVIVATNCELLLVLFLIRLIAIGFFRASELTFFRSARRHPLRSSSSSRRLNWNRSILEPRPQSSIPEHVRANPRLSARYRRQRHRQPSRCFLVRGRDGSMGRRR
jgi:hypothetical protein